MLNTERRIAALEASASDDKLKVIIVEDGETQVDALTRSGYPSHAPGVVFGLPSDAML
jgi:predicted alpha/beta-hydrolase family hydrolase